MTSLIICLPSSSPSASVSYDFVLTGDGHAAPSHASATASMLPRLERGVELVALIPVQMLSWHRVTLPKGVGLATPRLRLILESLLEDHLLDEPDQVHLAIEPDASAGSHCRVAACSKAWLRSHLEILESNGLPVTRIVPEIEPQSGPLAGHAIGDPDALLLVLTGQAVDGLVLLPLTPVGVALIPVVGVAEEDSSNAQQWFAEPLLAATAEAILQRTVMLQTRSQRCLEAARSSWDLAQFELVSSSRVRTVKRMSDVFVHVINAPSWRPARWGVVVALLVNLIGLNAWAWKEQSAQRVQRRAIDSMLTTTFPQVGLVVDAPLQMERQVAALRQTAGATSGRDLEAILAAVAEALPAEKSITTIDYIGAEARLMGLPLNDAEWSALNGRLQALGYAVRKDGDALVVKPEAKSDTQPASTSVTAAGKK